MMTAEIFTNCTPCMKGYHDDCNHKNCLCENDDHGIKKETIEDIFNNPNYLKPENEPRKYENSLKDIERLEELIDNGRGNNSEEYTIRELTDLLISSKHLVSIIDIERELKDWCIRFDYEDKNLTKLILEILSDAEIFKRLKQICFKLGQSRIQTVFDKSQLIESSIWLMGRYNIKRLELTGELLFFNDEYYEKNAEALIRRRARIILLKSKNNDMNEIVKYIEDSCKIITSEDIAKSVHLKCLLNGTYNIKTGIFTKSFNPDNIILNQISHNFDEDVKFDEINNRVSEIIIDEKDKQSYFDFSSTCLHPYTGIDIQFGGVGIAGTGKTQLTKLLEIVFGNDNVTYATIHSIAKDPTTRKDIAFGFVNIDEEMRTDDVSNTEILKKWITQGGFSDRGIYERNSNYRPTSRLMFATNGIYEIANPEDALAIYERTHLIKLTQKFRHTERELKNPFEMIDNIEFDGFITYLLKNATVIFKNKNIKYPQTTFETESLWNEYGNQIRNFIDTWLEKDIAFKEQSSEIWNRFFKEQSAKGLPPRGRNQFYKKFDEIIGSTAISIRDDEEKYWGYLGYKLKTEDQKSEQEKIDQTPKGKVLKILRKLEDDNSKFDKILMMLK